MPSILDIKINILDSPATQTTTRTAYRPHLSYLSVLCS